MTIHRKAFSTLQIKSTDEKNGKRTFKGIASTPTPDLVDDIVEPKGAEFQLPLPFLWQHDRKDPIGWITKANVTDDGIAVEGEIADVDEEGTLKERLKEAWQMLKSKLVRGLSIGFKALETAEIEGTWGVHIIKWLWVELSAVTIPENMEANIVTVKTAFGHKLTPGVPEIHEMIRNMKTLQEQLVALKEARATKVARMKELSDIITAKSATPEDNTEFDTLTSEI